MTIINTQTVYLDDVTYLRVTFKETNVFEDIEAEMYESWKADLDHTESK